MPTQTTMRSCERCHSTTMHLQQRPNHLLHLVLALVTAGIWLIPWVLIAGSQRMPVCTQCGARAKDRVGNFVYGALGILFLFGLIPPLILLMSSWI